MEGILAELKANYGWLDGQSGEGALEVLCREFFALWPEEEKKTFAPEEKHRKEIAGALHKTFLPYVRFVMQNEGLGVVEAFCYVVRTFAVLKYKESEFWVIGLAVWEAETGNAYQDPKDFAHLIRLFLVFVYMYLQEETDGEMEKLFEGALMFLIGGLSEVNKEGEEWVPPAVAFLSWRLTCEVVRPTVFEEVDEAWAHYDDPEGECEELEPFTLQVANAAWKAEISFEVLDDFIDVFWIDRQWTRLFPKLEDEGLLRLEVVVACTEPGLIPVLEVGQGLYHSICAWDGEGRLIDHLRRDVSGRVVEQDSARLMRAKLRLVSKTTDDE